MTANLAVSCCCAPQSIPCVPTCACDQVSLTIAWSGISLIGRVNQPVFAPPCTPVAIDDLLLVETFTCTSGVWIPSFSPFLSYTVDKALPAPAEIQISTSIGCLPFSSSFQLVMTVRFVAPLATPDGWAGGIDLIYRAQAVPGPTGASCPPLGGPPVWSVWFVAGLSTGNTCQPTEVVDHGTVVVA